MKNMVSVKSMIVSIAVVSFGLFSSMIGHAGSLIKLDISSQEELVKALNAVKVSYADKFPTFRASNFLPHTTLLFLSARNDDSDLTNLLNDGKSAAQLVIDAAREVKESFPRIEFQSEVKISHLKGSPSGVPSAGIQAGTPYHAVVLELPKASTALTPLMESLRSAISKTVLRASANDYAPRVHITVGYVIGATESDIVDVEDLPQDILFSTDHYTVDFPAMDGFKNVAIH